MVGLHEEWPEPGLLLEVRRRVTSLALTHPGPVLIHCRCGGGRTAVYTAVDFCLHQLQAEDRVDVYSTVLHLRRFRKNMVRTLNQYQQVYEAVAMFLQCGVTVYPAETLSAAYHIHYAQSGDAKRYRLDKEFQTLQSIVPRLSIGDCASGHRVENRSKSRDIMMLPPECARPYLTTADCGDSGTDFINAVYVDGYHAENNYLVTQWPMRRTTPDLWRMLFDFKITSFVFMHDPQKFSRSYPRFWPKEIGQDACYGPIRVRYLGCERKSNLVVRTFAIRKIMNNLVGCELRQDELIVKMFQVVTASGGSGDSVKCRSGGGGGALASLGFLSSSRAGRGLDSSGGGGGGSGRYTGHRGVGVPFRSLLSAMDHVAEWQRQSGNRQPVCIISKDGSSRVGVYCAVAICCDQVRAEREVDVFTAVRYVRKNRPQLVPNVEEYRYIYRFMTEFIALTSSKPDIVICEPTLDATSFPHGSHFGSVVTPTVVHGGVYVTNKPTSCQAGDRDTLGNSSSSYSMAASVRKTEGDFLSISHTGTYRTGGGASTSPASGSNSAEAVDRESSSTAASREDHQTHTKQKSFTSPDHTANPAHIAVSEYQINPILRTNPAHPRENGQTMTGDTPRTKAAPPLSINHQLRPDSTDMPASLLPADCARAHPGPASPNKTAPPSPSFFLTPGQYLGGFNNFSDSMSQSSHLTLCKSNSFYSCTSHLSIISNHGNGELLLNGSPLGSSCLLKTPLGSTVNGGLMNGHLSRPSSINGNLHQRDVRTEDVAMCKLPSCRSHSDMQRLADVHQLTAKLANPISPLQPDLSHMKAHRNSSDTTDIKLIHASYASLDDSLSGSLDPIDHHSSPVWSRSGAIDNSRGRNKHSPKQSQKRSNRGEGRHVILRSNGNDSNCEPFEKPDPKNNDHNNCVRQLTPAENSHPNTRRGNDASTSPADIGKAAASAFTWKLKIKGCRYKKKVKKALVT
ncbi:uncharacterized protein LOC101850889 isoform X2 [Aplysia californica]|uniref:Uncharacterized protein LOC101850889 isoform X2 n=1 Tax=Aplysia californica TaxID=6500 RepID=A0ABM1A017_APLCA|nr:uncharacterized protein LOC101850889 isoform X2 [Aplysia californica]